MNINQDKEKRISHGLKILGITPADFPGLIREYRINAGFTYGDLANYIGGIHSTTVLRWEKGQRVPNNRFLIGRLRDLHIV